MGTMGHAGLTLATSLGACVNAGLLFWFLRRDGYYAPQPGWLPFLAKLVVALAVLGATLVWLVGPTPMVARRRGYGSGWDASPVWSRPARSPISARSIVLGFRLADFNRREAEE